MLSSKAAATCGQCVAKNCAANFATFSGFATEELEEPARFVKQELFMPSGGQDTTGNLAKEEATPERASEPLAQLMSIKGSVDLLYWAMRLSKRPGCLWAEQILIWLGILNFASSVWIFSGCPRSEPESATMTTKPPTNMPSRCKFMMICLEGDIFAGNSHELPVTVS